jgi:nitrate/TMAO reductase-like tetraheme cytochrome c subunit
MPGGSAAKVAVTSGLALGGLLALALTALAVTAVTTPFCTWCHASSSFTQETAASAHASIACPRCHAAGGVTSRVVFASEQLFSMALRLGPDRGREGAAVSNDTCLSCHGVVMGRPTTSRSLAIRHSSCSTGALCSDCHSGTAHASAVRWRRTYSMNVCIGCHLAEQASRDCETCHVDAPGEASTSQGAAKTVHESNWKSIHGMGDWNTCAACHSPSYCASCHGIPLPHAGDFATRHSETVSAAPDSCAKCHTEAFCLDCHGTPMPHEAGFTPRHPAIVETSGESGCLRCHLKEDCTNCHVTHVHPGGAVAPGPSQ